jgi:endonuclease G
MTFTHLPEGKIRELIEAAISHGLHKRRDALLAVLSDEITSNLPVLPIPRDQLASDLRALNRRLARDGTLPIKQWLEEAVHLIGGGEDAASFQRALDGLDVSQPQGPTLTDSVGLSEIQEKVIHTDDRKPFWFLKKGLIAGASVAKLDVPQYRATNRSGSYVHGTGWLIGPELLMTAFHVVNARDDDEFANDEDLHLQIKYMTATFGFDRDDDRGTSIEVTGLAASDRRLDYAVVRLASSPRTRPLQLAPQQPKTRKKSRSALNIIQHPDGESKRVAIRNNLLTSMTDRDLYYFTDTSPGASGAPVLDDDWQVVALHRATTINLQQVENFQGQKSAYVNVGTRIDQIREHLRTFHSEVWGEINRAEHSEEVAETHEATVTYLPGVRREPDRRVPDTKRLEEMVATLDRLAAEIISSYGAGRPEYLWVKAEAVELLGLMGAELEAIAPKVHPDSAWPDPLLFRLDEALRLLVDAVERVRGHLYDLEPGAYVSQRLSDYEAMHKTLRDRWSTFRREFRHYWDNSQPDGRA